MMMELTAAGINMNRYGWQIRFAFHALCPQNRFWPFTNSEHWKLFLKLQE
jgi:hypothetical protein